jgi:hypothetical protein
MAGDKNLVGTVMHQRLSMLLHIRPKQNCLDVTISQFVPQLPACRQDFERSAGEFLSAFSDPDSPAMNSHRISRSGTNSSSISICAVSGPISAGSRARSAADQAGISVRIAFLMPLTEA